MRAEILTIGDELCRGEIVNTNSAYLAARLWDLDITTAWMTSCADDPADMRSAITTAIGRADLVVTSGGLGPTEDDLTVDVVAELAGVAAEIDAPARAKLETLFASRSRGSGMGSPALAAIQLRQVRVPAGSRVFTNGAGLAPGFEVAIGGRPVICLPGPPKEIHSIMDGVGDGGLSQRLAALREGAGQVERIARRIYRVFGIGESQISQQCRGLVDGVPGTTIHYQVKFPETLVKLVVRDPSRADADARLAQLDARIRDRLGAQLYGIDAETLVERAPRRLIAAGKTIAPAESCTGGMIGELLTRIPGSSRAFLGGAIVYSNAEKIRQLGVAPTTLDAHGAVSEETVREMAAGALDRFGVDYAVAVSGIAGPDGGTPDKPVGLVWICLARRDGAPEVRKMSWPGSREQIRTLAAWWALRLVDLALEVPRG